MALFGFGADKEEKATVPGVIDADMPVQEKMIWICEKCGFKLADDESENPTRKLQKALKSIIGDHKRKREVRAMVTSCMNVCPSRKIAAAIIDLKGQSPRFVECDFDGDVEKTAERLYKLL